MSTIDDTKKAPEDADELLRLQEDAQLSWEKIGELHASERQKAADAWAAEHGHLFFWCCGSPVFGGPSAEEYYVKAEYARGNAGTVYWP